MLFRLRVPRVLLAAEVGAALSVAGVALQALLRNPLADPFVFGLSGGAAIGTAAVTVASGTAVGAAALSAASWLGLLPAQLAAVAGALLAAFFVFTLGRARGQLEPDPRAARRRGLQFLRLRGGALGRGHAPARSRRRR